VTPAPGIEIPPRDPDDWNLDDSDAALGAAAIRVLDHLDAIGLGNYSGRFT